METYIRFCWVGTVGIAAGYRLDGLGIESRWGEIFRTSLDRPWDPQWIQETLLPRVKRLGLGADPHPHLAPRLKKEQN